MAARVGLLLRALLLLLLLLWGGLDARLSERVGQELRREAEVRGVCGEKVHQNFTFRPPSRSYLS